MLFNRLVHSNTPVGPKLFLPSLSIYLHLQSTNHQSTTLLALLLNILLVLCAFSTFPQVSRIILSPV